MAQIDSLAEGGLSTPVVPAIRFAGRGRLAFDHGGQPHFTPAVHGVDACAVGAELDLSGGRSHRPGRRVIGVDPLPATLSLLLADAFDGVIADLKVTEFPEIDAGAVERPAHARERDHPPGPRCDRSFAHARPGVQWNRPALTGRTVIAATRVIDVPDDAQDATRVGRLELRLATARAASNAGPLFFASSRAPAALVIRSRRC